MRGKVIVAFKMHKDHGITPAYAGKSRHEWGVYRANQDHPRLCGEKPSPAKRNCYKTGSPPPMRGKVFYGFAVRNGFGITPAYAGKSHVFSCPHALKKDHPRLCGEKLSILFPENL